MNLIIDDLPERDVKRWIDLPPPRKDLEIGVGEHVAWQTPIYREAVKMTLKNFIKAYIAKIEFIFQDLCQKTFVRDLPNN